MNLRPIKGHVNLSTLHKVANDLGGMDENDLEQQLLWIAHGIKAAKAKMARAQSKLKANKYLIRRRNTLPQDVVSLAVAGYNAAEIELQEAEFEKMRFQENYRNFRSIAYIRKSLGLLVSE